MNDILAVAIGVVLGTLASVPVAWVIAAPTRRGTQRPPQRLPDVQRAELVCTDQRMAVPWPEYVAVVDAINDKLASPDPYTRQLAAAASLALEDVAVPTW